MEQAQKKVKKQTEKESKPTKSTSTKQTKTVKDTVTKAEAKPTKVGSTKKEAKTVKTSTNKKEPKTAKATTTSKTEKANAPKKETKTVKTAATKVESKTVRTKKEVTTAPKASTKAETKKTTKTSTRKIEPKEANVAEKSVKEDKSKKMESKPTVKLESSKIEKETIKNRIKEDKNISNIENKEKTVPVDDNKKVDKTKRKYIDISVGFIIAMVLIILLVIINIKLGIHAYNVTKGKDSSENANLNSQQDNLTQEVGHVLNKKNEIVTKLMEKITFAPSATASIYKVGSFNLDTIPNDLKLRLGWAKIKDEDKLRAQKENGEEIIAVELEQIKEKISNVFGARVEYDNQSFNNTDVKTFSAYSSNPGVINFNNDLYVANPIQEEPEGVEPFIYQEIQKVLQYSDRIIVHVKTAFISVEDGKYAIYKDYDNSFVEKLLEITPEELLKDSTVNQRTGEGTITLEANTALDGIRDTLDTYTYTLRLDEEAGEYYLSEFNKQIAE